MENEFYRLPIDPPTGAITSLVDKESGREFLAGPANVIARETDKGDLWELYRGLDGGSKFAMTRKQPVPRPGAATFSSEFKDKPGTVRTGPVLSEFRVQHSFANGAFATALRLYAGMRRWSFATTLVNNE